MKTLLIALFFLCLGVVGSILTAFPDMFPYSDRVNIFPHLASLDTGFADLNTFDEIDEDDKAISVLRRGDEGYGDVYNLLRVFAPNIVSSDAVAESPNKNLGAIFAFEGQKWSNPQGEIAIVRPVLILLEEQKPVPVCDLRDLAFLVRDLKVSSWARFGSSLTIVALFGQAMPIIIGAIQSLQRSEQIPPQVEIELERRQSNSAKDPTVKNTGETALRA